MKSRRHRSIDKAEKKKPMIHFNHENRTIKKQISKDFKEINNEFYKGMLVHWNKVMYG